VQSVATEFKVESFADVVKAVHDATGEYLAIDAMIAQATERHSGLQDLLQMPPFPPERDQSLLCVMPSDVQAAPIEKSLTLPSYPL
jgi:hypothetical protein